MASDQGVDRLDRLALDDVAQGGVVARLVRLPNGRVDDLEGLEVGPERGRELVEGRALVGEAGVPARARAVVEEERREAGRLGFVGDLRNCSKSS